MTKKPNNFTVNQVAQHNSYDDCWIMLGEMNERKVYDITAFLDDHPGGPEILMDLAGQYAHDEFEDVGHSMDARQLLEGLYIGDVEEPTSKSHKKQDTETKPLTSNKPEQKGNVPIHNGPGVVFAVGAIVALIIAMSVYSRSTSS